MEEGVLRRDSGAEGLGRTPGPSGISMAEAQRQVLDYIRKWVPEPGKAPLAGNSVGTDRTFLVRDMPEVVEHLHYRIIDVSTIKELSRRWFPRAYFQSPDKTGNHRALGDIKDSIDELRYYREAVFVDDPGPSSEQAKEAASRVVAARRLAEQSTTEDDPQRRGLPKGPVREGRSQGSTLRYPCGEGDVSGHYDQARHSIRRP